MYLPETLKSLSVEELIPYCEMYQNYKRFYFAIRHLLPKIKDGFKHSGARTEVTRENNICTIKIFKDGEICAISTMPWFDDFYPDIENTIRSFAIIHAPYYEYYGHAADVCVCDLHMVKYTDSCEYITDVTKEITDAIIEDFDLDTSRFPYFNPTVFHYLLEKWKKSNDEHITLSGCFLAVLEEDFGPNGKRLNELKQLFN